MRKKLVSLAVAAGLTAGMGSAHAVHVNSDGLGQVLLYPFYSVEGGNDTYIAIANTTNAYKAVKVRVLEAMDSQEVLDFNLYLSPNDHWSGVISATATGAQIQTRDTSCTVPNALAATVVDGEVVPGDAIAFRTFAYGGTGGEARTREGYIEVIEMGEVTDATYQANILHVNGEPGDCAALEARWAAAGAWDANPDDGMAVPAGGLYGYGVLINVAEGTDATYDATALDNFSALTLHSNPGDTLPNLGSGVSIANVIDGTNVHTVGFTDAIDAVSSVMMHDFIMNDYVLEPTIDAGTDWVINFPTKREYVPADGLFTAAFAHPTGACEEITIDYWNREEAFVVVDPEGVDFSPTPPPDVAPPLSLCFEANVLTFNESEVLFPSDRVRRNLDVNYENGWARIGFANVDPTERVLVGTELDAVLTPTGNDVTFEGLPVIGFAVHKYVNGTLESGVLSNYGGLINHKATRDITIAPTP